MLCALALDDESTLQFPLPDQIYGFHAQQSCEKLLKALIAAHGRTYPFTHSLEKLADMLEGCGEHLPALPYDLEKLEIFAVDLRYDIGETLSDAERTSIRDSVAVLREHVLSRILALESN